MMRWLKRTLLQLAVGAGAGFALWNLMGIRLTSVLFSSIGGTFSCENDVTLALGRFVSMQLYSALLGAVLGVGLSLIVGRMLRKRRGPGASSTPVTAPGAGLGLDSSAEPPARPK